MSFTIKTEYNQNTLTQMARALRKTVRKKKSLITHIFGAIIILLGIVFLLPEKGTIYSLSAPDIVTIVAIVFLLVVLIFEDRINGFLAFKRLLPGLKSSETQFNEQGYHMVTELGESFFNYDKISSLAETKDFYVFIFGKSHAQSYAKVGLTGGSAEEFKAFIEERCNMKMKSI